MPQGTAVEPTEPDVCGVPTRRLPGVAAKGVGSRCSGNAGTAKSVCGDDSLAQSTRCCTEKETSTRAHAHVSLRDAVAALCAPTGFRDWNACAAALAPASSSPSASLMMPKAVAPRTRHWRAEIESVAMPLRAHGRVTLKPHC